VPKSKRSVRLVSSPYAWIKIGGRVQRLSMLGAFLLLFISVGTYAVEHSSADSGYCVNYGYDASLSGQYIGCVQNLQFVLNQWNAKTGAGISVTQSGHYDATTAQAVADFQHWATLQGLTVPIDGKMGSGTWSALCLEANRLQYNYDGIGCAANHLL